MISGILTGIYDVISLSGITPVGAKLIISLSISPYSFLSVFQHKINDLTSFSNFLLNTWIPNLDL